MGRRPAALPGQQTRQGRRQDLVARFHLRPTDLALEYGELVPQDQQLDLLALPSSRKPAG